MKDSIDSSHDPCRGIYGIPMIDKSVTVVRLNSPDGETVSTTLCLVEGSRLRLDKTSLHIKAMLANPSSKQRVIPD